MGELQRWMNLLYGFTRADAMKMKVNSNSFRAFQQWQRHGWPPASWADRATTSKFINYPSTRLSLIQSIIMRTMSRGINDEKRFGWKSALTRLQLRIPNMLKAFALPACHNWCDEIKIWFMRSMTNRAVKFYFRLAAQLHASSHDSHGL